MFVYFSNTFERVPWPAELVQVWKVLQIFSIDPFSVLGSINCSMQSNFLLQFELHMCLIPMALFCIFVGACLAKVCCHKSYKKSKAIELINYVLLLAFTGLSLKIFRIFKCQFVQDKSYLNADYNILCYEGKWYNYAVISGYVVFSILYVYHFQRFFCTV